MQNVLEYALFSLFSKIFCLAGFKRAHMFAPFLTFIFHDLIKLRRNVVLKNLSIAFPEMSEVERKVLCRKCYVSAAKTFIEIMGLPALKYHEVESFVSDEVAELGRQMHSRGKGVVLLTAHFGNWELGAVVYARRMGLPVVSLTQEQRNGYVAAWMEKARTMWGNKVVRTGHAAMTLFKSLRNGEMIGVVGDQRGPRDGLHVPFFGRSSAVNEGSALLALRAGSPILMCFMVRNEDNSYSLHAHEISFEGLPQDMNKKVEEITRRHTALLEEYIRRYPEQWFWMHNRWKY